DDPPVARDLAEPLVDLAHRDPQRAGRVAGLPFLGLTHVEQHTAARDHWVGLDESHGGDHAWDTATVGEGPLPLAGRVIGVTAERRAEEQADLLRKRGAEV